MYHGYTLPKLSGSHGIRRCIRMLLAVVIRQLRGLTGPHIWLLNAQSQAGAGPIEFTVTWMKRMRHTACGSVKFANSQGTIEGIAHRGSSTMLSICCYLVEAVLFSYVVEPTVIVMLLNQCYFVMLLNQYCFVMLLNQYYLY